MWFPDCGKFQSPERTPLPALWQNMATWNIRKKLIILNGPPGSICLKKSCFYLAPERRSFCPLCSSDLPLAPATHHHCPALVHCLPESHSTSSRYKLLIEEVTAVELDARRGNSRQDLKEKSSHQGIIFIYCTLYIP